MSFAGKNCQHFSVGYLINTLEMKLPSKTIIIHSYNTLCETAYLSRAANKFIGTARVIWPHSVEAPIGDRSNSD